MRKKYDPNADPDLTVVRVILIVSCILACAGLAYLVFAIPEGISL